ncbi:MAG TPA: MFS transporter [Streptosporangiaceae bacterium]
MLTSKRRTRRTPGNPAESGIAVYARLLRKKSVTSLLASAFITYTGFSGRSLALLLYVDRERGSLAVAGAVVAVSTLGSALVAPVRGRLLDNFGQTRVTVPLAAAYAVSFAAFIAVTRSGAPAEAMYAIAAIGGACFPAVFASMRSIWSKLFEGTALLNTAYSLEAVTQGVAVMLGPLAVSAVVTVATPAAALGVSIGLTSGGALLFAASPLSRTWRNPRPAGGRAWVLASQGMRFLIPSICLFGITEGAVQVAAPAFAVRAGWSSGAGVLLASMAFGSMIGGLWFGVKKRQIDERLYTGLLGCSALALVTLPLIKTTILLIPALAIVGLCIAPVFTCVFSLLDKHAPVGTGTEAFTWVASGSVGGASAGAALAGVIAQHVGTSWAFVFSFAATAMAFGVAVTWWLVLGKQGAVTAQEAVMKKAGK